MEDETRCASGPVVRVVAHVQLESEAEKRAKVEGFRNSDWANKPRELARIEESILDPSAYKMKVRLSADLADGRRIIGGGFEFGGPRRGVSAIWWRYRGPPLSDDEHKHERLLHETYHVGRPDIEDAIDQMLGREPEQHRHRGSPGKAFKPHSSKLGLMPRRCSDRGTVGDRALARGRSRDCARDLARHRFGREVV